MHADKQRERGAIGLVMMKLKRSGKLKNTELKLSDRTARCCLIQGWGKSEGKRQGGKESEGIFVKECEQTAGLPPAIFLNYDFSAEIGAPKLI